MNRKDIELFVLVISLVQKKSRMLLVVMVTTHVSEAVSVAHSLVKEICFGLLTTDSLITQKNTTMHISKFLSFTELRLILVSLPC